MTRRSADSRSASPARLEREGRPAPALADSTRAQAEVTGSTLMVGVVVVVVVLAGSLLLANYLDDATSTAPPVELNATATATNVELSHAGGVPLESSDVTVVLHGDGTESRSTLASWTVDGDGDGRFEPAERATRSHGFGSGPVEVVVVHRPTRSVLLDESVPFGS